MDSREAFRKALGEVKHTPTVGDTVDGTVLEVGEWDNGRSKVSRVVVAGDNGVLFTLLGASNLVPAEELVKEARVLLEFSAGGGSGYGAIVDGNKVGKLEVERSGHWRVKAKI